MSKKIYIIAGEPSGDFIGSKLISQLNESQEDITIKFIGGDLMEKWANQYLQGERDLVSNRKDSKMRADDISSMTGERKNSHLKKHTKNFNFRIPTNLIKSNSDKGSISPITSLGLFEEVDKIKKLIKY